MKTLLYILCLDRSISIPQGYTTQFLETCKNANVHPSNGAYKNGQVTYDLPNPITHEEAMVIAGRHNLLGEYQYCIDTLHMTPFEALAEWDLL